MSKVITLPDYATYNDVNKLPVENGITFRVGVMSLGVKQFIMGRFPGATIIRREENNDGSERISN